MSADYTLRRRVAESLHAIEWFSETQGHCPCPGAHLHSTDNLKTDCVVFVDGGPNLFCLHQSCRDACIAATTELARAIGFAEREEERIGSYVPLASTLHPRPLPKLKPVYDIELIVKVVADGPGLADLWEESPHRWDDELPHTEEIIDAIYPNGGLLCVGENKDIFDTKSREEWRGQLAGQQFLVPNLMSARTGITLKGTPSPHAKSNTGPRIYCVVECDFSELNRQGNEHWCTELVRAWRSQKLTTLDAGAAILWHLQEYWPLRLAVHSGGKSLHGWFPCDSKTETEALSFCSYAYNLGADRGCNDAWRFVRMPDGLRENGRRQTVYYFDPPSYSHFDYEART